MTTTFFEKPTLSVQEPAFPPTVQKPSPPPTDQELPPLSPSPPSLPPEELVIEDEYDIVTGTDRMYAQAQIDAANHVQGSKYSYRTVTPESQELREQGADLRFS